MGVGGFFPSEMKCIVNLSQLSTIKFKGGNHDGTKRGTGQSAFPPQVLKIAHSEITTSCTVNFLTYN